jgi:dTDP-4-amino-4,6-dideoxygalactose transaminase
MRLPGERDAVRERLAERGVDSRIYYPIPVHMQPYIQDVLRQRPPRLPVTERLATEVLSIPVRRNLTRSELERVICAVAEVATPLKER